MYPFSRSKSASAPVIEPDDPGIEESSGIFDPVPALSTIGVCGVRNERAHDLESRVQRRLLGEPGLHFKSLTVRRMGNGSVCIEGVLTGSCSSNSLSDLVADVDGVQEVINHVLVCQGEDC